MMRRKSSWLLALAASSLSSAASAHLTLTTPPARHPAADLKDGPCGVGPVDERTTDPTKITTYQAGETITVTWTETVDHDPAHYRVAFSAAGDNFEDPTGYDDIRSGYPILLDGIPDADAGRLQEYSVEVTLPNEPCDACSLQVIQVMHDKPPWGPGGGNDIYYQCADIVIEAADPTDPDPGTPPEPDPGAGGAHNDSPTATTGGTAGTPPGGEATGGSVDPSAPDADNEPGSSSDASSDSGGCAYETRRSRPAWWSLALLSALMLRRRRSAQLGSKPAP